MVNIDRLFKQPENERVFIAAEIGINHQGHFDFAKKMIDASKESGADAVKFQVFRTEKFYNQKISPSAFDLFKTFELSFDDYLKLKEYADSIDILFFATPLEFDSLDFLISIHCPMIKIASSDITNEPFLYRVNEEAKKQFFKVCLSTGFVELKRIERSIKILKDSPLAVLYCVSKYPSEGTDYDLHFIQTLKKKYKMPVGFSDHSLDIHYSLAAVTLGAKIIERHFTTDNSLEGADHSISLNPENFKKMVVSIRDIESALGSGRKKITSFEKNITLPSMRDIYSSRLIKKGEVITEKDLLLLRPGPGVNYREYKKWLNKKSVRDIEPYEKI